MSEIIGKWQQPKGQPFPGLWFEFHADGTFEAQYDEMGITSSGAYHAENGLIEIEQTKHSYNMLGKFLGLYTVEGDTLTMNLGEVNAARPRDIKGINTRVYLKMSEKDSPLHKPKPLTGITNKLVDTARLQMNVYFSGRETGIPVVFLHGNFSAALYWEETMLALPAGYRGIAPDLRGYGWTEDKLIDSTRGLRDLSDDLAALLETLKIKQAHFVGWSMGAGVLYRFITDYPGRALSLTLVCPVSPYGFGGSKFENGAPCYADFAGSGGGVVNPTFIQLILAGDRGAADPNSPRNVINSFYYKPPFKAAREEDFLTAALAEKIGPEKYPGDFTPSANWPNVAPGVKGIVNCWSPKYLTNDVAELLDVTPKPPILWVRGDSDMIVSDNSMFDFGALGKLGFIPGWPGDEVYPPQPMLVQTRYVFERYAVTGGSFSEHVIADAAHSPHIEKPAEFNALFHAFLHKAKK